MEIPTPHCHPLCWENFPAAPRALVRVPVHRLDGLGLHHGTRANQGAVLFITSCFRSFLGVAVAGLAEEPVAMVLERWDGVKRI